MRFENEFYNIIKNVSANSKVKPLNLGGIAGPGGGAGGPPGGFRGSLPQTRVSYDEDEYEIYTTSGDPSLLDNLNHIRWRISQIPSGVGFSKITVSDTEPINPYSGDLWVDIS